MADEKEEIIDLTELIERGRPTPADAKPVEEHIQALNDQKTLKEAAELDAMLNSLDANKKKKKNDAEEMDLADMDKMLNELGLAPKEEERPPNTVDTLLGKAGLAMPEKTAQTAKDSGSPQASPAAKTAAQGQNHHEDLDLDALLNEALQTAEQLKGDTPATETAHGQADQDLDALLRSDPASAPETPTATSEDIDALLAQAAQPKPQPAQAPAPAPAEVDLDALLAQAAQPETQPAPEPAAQAAA
ncbi:MAG: hypothetical protein J5838_06375, partial [Desulfovibrio sp.]|nr:hypothetical protein [Desulfovibrio sp.]